MRLGGQISENYMMKNLNTKEKSLKQDGKELIFGVSGFDLRTVKLRS